jgi:hypothetical protein
MKKTILLFLSIVSFALINAMEYQCDDTKQLEDQVESTEHAYVTLVSSDGHEFKVPQSIAFQVPWFEAALTSTMKEGQEQEIKLPYSAEILEALLKIMAAFAQSRNLSEILVQTKALFADYEPIKDIYMECIDKLQLPWLPFIPVITKDLYDRHKENLQAIEQEILATFSDPAIRGLIARFHYLNYGKLKQFLNVKADYGFSIAELNKANLLPAIKMTNRLDILDLSNLKINNLKGLLGIPDIEDVNELNLSNNQIELKTFLAALKDIKNTICGMLIIKFEHNPLTHDLLIFKTIFSLQNALKIMPLSSRDSEFFKRASFSESQLSKGFIATQEQLMLENKDLLEELSLSANQDAILLNLEKSP